MFSSFLPEKGRETHVRGHSLQGAGQHEKCLVHRLWGGGAGSLVCVCVGVTIPSSPKVE